MRINRLKFLKNCGVCLSLILLLLLPLIIELPYLTHILIFTFLYITLATGWNITSGYAGQINFGYAAFFGVGAYTTSLLWLNNIFLPVSILMGGIGAVLLGTVIFPCFKLRGPYFIIGTLGLGEIFRIIMLNLDFTGGARGLILPVQESLPVFYNYLFSLLLALMTIIMSFKIRNSKIGLYFIAIREDEEAAENIGIHVFKYKCLASSLSVFPAGIAGGIYAAYVLYVDPPGVCSIIWTIIPAVACIIGGMGTIAGPIIGAVIYSSLSAVFPFLSPIIRAESFHLIWGVLLIIIILALPKGIVDLLRLKPLKKPLRR